MSGGRLRAGLLAALAATACCGGSAAPARPPDLWLLARWLKAPPSPAEIGYEIDAELGSRNSEARCTSPPPADLRVSVDDREATSLGSEGACDWNVLYRVRALLAAGTTAVRVSDDAGPIGEAMYRDLVPPPPTLLTPADGRVSVGGQVTIAIPSGLTLAAAPEGRLYWRGGSSGAAPTVSAAPTELAADGTRLTATIPATPGGLGPASLVFETGTFASGGAESCAGLSSCTSTVERVLGPIALDVTASPP